MTALRTIGAWLLTMLPMVGSSPLMAQVLPDADPRIVSTMWVLAQDSITDLGHRLLVENVHMMGVGKVPLPDGEAEIRQRLAELLGARVGGLMNHLRCPSAPPRAREWAEGLRRGCTLNGGVTAVVQTNPPQPSGDRVVVGVTTWVFRRDAAGRRYEVTSVFREVLLRSNASGAFSVEGVGLMGIAHW